MATVAQIRAAIKAKLDAIPNLGKVNNHEPYAAQHSKLAPLYITDLGGGQKRLQGLFIAWRGREKRSPGLGRYAITDRWEMRYFYATQEEDGSELAFDTLVETVSESFDADENLGGLISSTVLGSEGNDGPAGVQVLEKNYVVFCGALCHSARMQLFTRHYR